MANQGIQADFLSIENGPAIHFIVIPDDAESAMLSIAIIYTVHHTGYSCCANHA